MKEFCFNGSTSLRFFNTLVFEAKAGRAREYISNYFKLIDNPCYPDLIKKLDSPEFNEIIKELKTVNPSEKINKRLVIYFGNQGTGKTTKAIKESPNARIMNCNSSLEPSDLLETFDFNNSTGAPVYKHTPLFDAIEEGNEVILEEMNLLTYDCLRAIQTLLDNKETFDYKGRKIEIKDGFKVIATMNLDVNGSICSLPEPLVDRAERLIEFEPSDEMIAILSFGE